MSTAKNTSEGAVRLITQKEGFRPHAYKDAGGVWTIGFGTAIDTTEEQYLLTATITEQQAYDLFQKDLIWVNHTIRKFVTVPLSQAKWDALASLIYNIGGTVFRRSKLLKAINAQEPIEVIEKLWMEFIYIKKKANKGLINRRTAEFNVWKS